MKIVTRTPKKAIIQVKKEELEINGFDFVWDEIRKLFPEQTFKLFQLDDNKEEDCIFFELTYREESFLLSLKEV